MMAQSMMALKLFLMRLQWNIIQYPKFNNILIEVKYRDASPISDNDAISLLCEESSASIVVTKSPADFGIHNAKNGFKMLRIPAFAWSRRKEWLQGN